MSHGTEPSSERFSRREFKPAELDLIREVVQSCSGLSQKDLAQTVCELLGWKRPWGALKARECWEFLQRLEAARLVELPDKRPRRPKGSRTRVPVTERGERGCELVGGQRVLPDRAGGGRDGGPDGCCSGSWWDDTTT